jgi:5'-deoxynucleotidase YfbR-like HD superfamily hydrolase
VRKEDLFTPNCIRTYSGIYMNIFEPTLDMICIENIAHSLSHQCRFGGHLPTFFSVAQHSIMVSEHVPQEHRLAALLHDASEAYLVDIPKPIKPHLTNYKELEDKLMELIALKFGFEYPLHPMVKKADELMLHWEWHTLMLRDGKCKGITPALHYKAKWEFMDLFTQLTELKAQAA